MLNAFCIVTTAIRQGVSGTGQRRTIRSTQTSALTSRRLFVARKQAFILQSVKGDSEASASKLHALKGAVQKYGPSGNGRIGLFGALVGWVDEQSYVPQVGASLYTSNHGGKYSNVEICHDHE